jgi:glyoxylase I family protein
MRKTDFGVSREPKADTTKESLSTAMAPEQTSQTQSFVNGIHGIRYQVRDVLRSVAFYTEHLGFKLEHQQLPAFASISLGSTPILLSGPGASGSRRMPDGRQQEPGGWNRVVLRVADLPTLIQKLKGAGVRFRNEMETGPGGKQIQIEDPDGNPIELFEPAGRWSGGASGATPNPSSQKTSESR